MHRRADLILLGVMLVASAATPRRAAACCTTIPPVSQVYQSDIGSVQQRLAAPGRIVRIVRKDCDLDGNGNKPPFFDEVDANNVIDITFTPDGAPSVAIPSLTSGTSGDCTGGDCRTLDFVMPDTDAFVGAPNDGIGLTGPARIVVRRNAVVVAHVETLHEPTDGCDKQSEDLFVKFTVLPEPNDITMLEAGSAPLRMTLDGGNNLLVPLDHRAARASGAASGLASFERGGANFCAKRPATLDPLCYLSPIDKAIKGAPKSRDLLQAFSIDGHRIAPLFARDDSGWLYGTADSDFSVLRIERAPRNNPAQKRFDLGYRRKDGKGPIVDGDYKAEVCHPANLAGLRSTADLVVHARAASDVHVHRVATAGHKCGKDTQTIAAEVDLGCVSEPCIEAENALAATIRKTDFTLQVFSPKGTRKTPPKSEVASLEPVLNRYPIVVADAHVYFRIPNGTLTLFDPSVGWPKKRFTGIRAAQKAEIVGTRVIALDPAPPHTVWVHHYGSASPTLLPANGSQLTTGNPLANAGDVVAAIEAQSDTVTAWPWPPSNGPSLPGAGQATGAIASGLGATQGCGPNDCASRVVLVTPEARQKADLNGDQDQLDRVLQLYDAVTKTLVSTKYAATEFVAGRRLVAFRVPESEQGRDLNGDTDKADSVLHVVAFDAPKPDTSRVVTTGYAAHVDCALQARLGWRDPYVVVDDEVLFLVSELEHGRDLNGDGPLDDVVLVIFQVPSTTADPVVTVTTTPLLPMDLLTPPTGLGLQGSGLAIGDHDRDGALDPFDSCQTRRNRRQVDDDYDGLGDRACDRRLCTDFRPPVFELSDADRKRIGDEADDAAGVYLRLRGKAQQDCLGQIALGGRPGDATVVCRGAFVEYSENHMLADHEDMDAAERKLLAALDVSERQRGPHALATLRRARLVVRAYGEAVNAATRAAYGNVVRDPSLAKDQARLGAATVSHLLALVEAMQACLLTPHSPTPEDIGALCMGRIERGVIIPPTHRSTASTLKEADTALGKVLSGPSALPLEPLRSCASSRSGEGDCFRCVTWRNAVRAVLSLVDRGVAPTPPAASL